MTAADLESLYDAHATALTGFLMALTGSESAARDVLQDVFVRLAHSPERMDALEEPRAFLITLARRAAADMARREAAWHRRHSDAAAAAPRLFAEDPAPDTGLVREELEQALQSLPSEQRTAAVLHIWSGLTFRQIAEAMDIPPNTAASRCRYALEKLRLVLRPLYDEIR